MNDYEPHEHRDDFWHISISLELSTELLIYNNTHPRRFSGIPHFSASFSVPYDQQSGSGFCK
jgi:hypothetical protein